MEYVKNNNNEFVCQHKDCNKVFKRQNTMYYHMKRHLQIFTYECKDCAKGFIQKSAYLHHIAAVHPTNNDICSNKEECEEEKNPYSNISFKCPSADCGHTTRTKANMIIHYARLHGKDWITSYDKESGCGQCKKKFSSVAAYLYHATGCIPASKTHRDMMALITERP